jgi:hypothetical protein
MDKEEVRFWTVCIVCATILLIGCTSCKMNQDYQFRIGNYCSYPGAQTDIWVKCK